MGVSMNADYRHMYLHLFHAVTDALSAMEQKNFGIAEELLKKGQIECEEYYMEPQEERPEE